MAEVESLMKSMLGEIERILSTKTVVGEPMSIEGNTIIPLVSIGFAFGGGGGSAEQGGRAGGGGQGTGGGGGVKPVGVIIVNSRGVQVEGVRGRVGGVVEAMTDGVTRIMEKRSEQKAAKESARREQSGAE